MKFETPSSNSLVLPGPVRAAQYVRMSTEHQQYSTLNQMEALREYANLRNIQIVRTYADEGKSGLRIDKRPALRQLIQDVISGNADFSIILVYDVSRWGRFQDADESAHYEFLCRQSGIHVEYCAEQFENDGNPVSALVKYMKRIMAAEYSRELSVKTFNGQRRSVTMGYHPGGPAGLGLRRLLLDKDGKPKKVLEAGEHKRLMTERIALIPGPAKEIAMVRQIFKECAAGTPIKVIAEDLNARGIRTVQGNLWTDSYVGTVLHNEKYIGNMVWNKASIKLRGKAVTNPPHEWVRSDGTIKPIISRALFDKAQKVIDRRRMGMPESELLDGLRRLLAEEGRLNIKLITNDPRIPSVMCYQWRFGGLLKAYEKIGYAPKTDWRRIEANHRALALRTKIAVETAEVVRQFDDSVILSNDKRTIRVASGFVVQFIVVRCSTIKSGALRWFLRPHSIHKAGAQLIVVVRMKPGDRDTLDYYLIPKEELPMVLITLAGQNSKTLDAYCSETLDPLYAVLAAGYREDVDLSERVLTAIEATRAQASVLEECHHDERT